MDILQKSTSWVAGEVTHGKISVFIAILLLIGVVFIFKSKNELLRGAIIPLFLMIALYGGYGAMQVIKRPQHLGMVKELYDKNPAQVLKQEIDKSTKDSNAYKLVTTSVWPILLVVCIVLSIFFSKDYYKGMTLGFALLFFSALIGDTILKHRVDIYLKELSSLT